MKFGNEFKKLPKDERALAVRRRQAGAGLASVLALTGAIIFSKVDHHDVNPKVPTIVTLANGNTDHSSNSYNVEIEGNSDSSGEISELETAFAQAQGQDINNSTVQGEILSNYTNLANELRDDGYSVSASGGINARSKFTVDSIRPIKDPSALDSYKDIKITPNS